jgi:hypothetical protein
MSSPTIDALCREVTEGTKKINEVSKPCVEVRAQLNQLFDVLVSENSSPEIKQKFQLVAMDLADKAAKVGELRGEFKVLSSKLVEAIKDDGREHITTEDGIELTLTPTVQFKLPEVKKEDEEDGHVESKE